VIMAATELALDGDSVDPVLRQDLEQVKLASQRAAVLTRQLLAFSRRQVLEPRVIRLADVVAENSNMLRSLLRDDIELVLPHAADTGRVYADPNQITQILMNLAANARDAMPAGGRLAIDVCNVVRDVDDPIGAGPYVELRLTDTGTGMDETTRQRVFEPFFTTKDVGKGTGLGLSTVFGIVKQSGGHISVESELGRGTSFRVLLPCTDREPRELGVMPSPATLAGRETVLLVDDDAQLRSMMRGILQRRGYTVLVGETPGDAMLIAEQHPTKIDLLLTDVVMPRMSGPELVRRLAALRPEMRVLMSSGYTEEVLFDDRPGGGTPAFIAKPFQGDELLRKVREVLDAPAPS